MSCLTLPTKTGLSLTLNPLRAINVGGEHARTRVVQVVQEVVRVRALQDLSLDLVIGCLLVGATQAVQDPTLGLNTQTYRLRGEIS